MDKILEVKDLKFSYDENRSEIQSLNGLTLSVGKGERIGILGPSGCGKSTLLKIISGMLKPTSGIVLFEGDCPEKNSRKISFLLQDYGLFPWKNVYENLSLPLKLYGESKKEIDRKVFEMIDFLNLQGKEKKYPKELSGGQRQKVALGRTLINSPQLLLLDEPFSALDYFTREELQEYTINMSVIKKLTYIMVTHNIEEAVYMCQRIIVFSENGSRKEFVIGNSKVSADTDFRETDSFAEYVKEIRMFIRGDRLEKI